MIIKLMEYRMSGWNRDGTKKHLYRYDKYTREDVVYELPRKG